MGRRHRQFRNRRGSRFCPAEPSRGVPPCCSRRGSPRPMRCCSMPPCSPPRAVPALRPHGLLRPSKPCTAMQRPRRRPKRLPLQLPTVQVPLSPRIPLSLMLLFRRPLPREVTAPVAGASSVDVTPSDATAPSAAIVSAAPGALRPQTRMSPPRVLPGSRFPAGPRHSIPFPPPRLTAQGCGGAARCRRGAKRREPAGGTPRSRFSG